MAAPCAGVRGPRKCEVGGGKAWASGWPGATDPVGIRACVRRIVLAPGRRKSRRTRVEVSALGRAQRARREIGAIRTRIDVVAMPVERPLPESSREVQLPPESRSECGGSHGRDIHRPRASSRDIRIIAPVNGILITLSGIRRAPWIFTLCAPSGGRVFQFCFARQEPAVENAESKCFVATAPAPRAASRPPAGAPTPTDPAPRAVAPRPPPSSRSASRRAVDRSSPSIDSSVLLPAASVTASGVEASVAPRVGTTHESGGPHGGGSVTTCPSVPGVTGATTPRCGALRPRRPGCAWRNQCCRSRLFCRPSTVDASSRRAARRIRSRPRPWHASPQ
jgi:hypothetical protein